MVTGVVIERIVCGGQTGADRAALDWAISHGVPHGGWCPAGRMAEDGVIPARYQLTELPGGGYRQRTEANVRDSDATLIVSIAPELTGGSHETMLIARRPAKPWLHLYPGMAAFQHCGTGLMPTPCQPSTSPAPCKRSSGHRLVHG